MANGMIAPCCHGHADPNRQAIGDGGGDYVLSLKENWPATFAATTMLFDQPPPRLAFETSQTVDGCNAPPVAIPSVISQRG
jgi:hypothetical protein